MSKVGNIQCAQDGAERSRAEQVALWSGNWEVACKRHDRKGLQWLQNVAAEGTRGGSSNQQAHGLPGSRDQGTGKGPRTEPRHGAGKE